MKKDPHHTHVEVLALERVDLQNKDAYKLFPSHADQAMEFWRQAHPSAKIISAIPAMAPGRYFGLLTITLLYEEANRDRSARIPMKKFRTRSSEGAQDHGCDDSCE